ncbi:MAG: transcription antitermination factor NusB [Acidimicrobiia bacterium]
MTRPGSEGTTIPARITVADLAQLLGRSLEEVQDVLHQQGEEDGPDHVLGWETAVALGRGFGEKLDVEPRDLALELLYEFETRGELSDVPEGRAGRLALGVVRDLDRLDAMIEEVSEHWTVARMPIVDRNILRIGLFELESEPEVPTAVIVSEAVRMAQTYSTERSASFVNGVLAALAKSVRSLA